MIQTLVIMILLLVVLSIVFLIKIKNKSLQITKNQEVNKQENLFEKKYQFIKGLF